MTSRSNMLSIFNAKEKVINPKVDSPILLWRDEFALSIVGRKLKTQLLAPWYLTYHVDVAGYLPVYISLRNTKRLADLVFGVHAFLYIFFKPMKAHDCCLRFLFLPILGELCILPFCWKKDCSASCIGKDFLTFWWGACFKRCGASIEVCIIKD